MSARGYVTNCPNCGAPLRGYGRCEYCGTRIEHPLQMLVVRPGLKKLVCQTKFPLEIGVRDPEALAEYAKQNIRSQMADALTESIKFVTQREFDPCRFEEVIAVRGELWVAEPNATY